MKLDPAIVAHLEWIGFVRPTGLVVSAPALVRAGAVLNRADAEGQRLLREVVQERTFSVAEEPALHAPDFRTFARHVLGWSLSAKGYAGSADSPIPPELELVLTDYSETLRPDFAVRELEPKEGVIAWQLLVKVLDAGEDFDQIVRGGGTLEASAHSRMERLLRHTGVSAGLLFNGRVIRLISAPRGESSGWLDFRINEMVQTAGRPISAAMRLLLRETRLLTGPRTQRLSALLEDSRKFQNEVSERLSEQVLHALYEMVRGFQTAHDASKGELLREPLAKGPDDIYRALLTVMLRLVFLLYAEERGMLPETETFLRNYSLGGLYERLREDAAVYPDTMDQRYGAWAQLLVLFRMVFDGATADDMHLPQRHGVLFDPNRFPFLEGRTKSDLSTGHQRTSLPLVPDRTIYRALEKLLVLDSERISYRALDVEQIGSVYETMMGFRLEIATGHSLAIKSQKKRGAPTALDLDALLCEPGDGRAKAIQDRAERKLTDKVRKAVADSATLEDLHAALLPMVDLAATPDLVPSGAMVLQPSEARRRSGSHYTPRELTEPIVRTALDPILARLRSPIGQPPCPKAILELKVCDPAMGSGAFLVETCRYLGDALLEAWQVHGGRPEIPPDEDELVFARRLVAQRCLYGVDRNPVAVDLTKVSLWLATMAKEHALTFLDHALRHGDSLIGLTRQQIENFHWDTSVTYDSPLRARLRGQVARFSSLRSQIRQAKDNVSDAALRGLWEDAQVELDKVRLCADLAISAFFNGEKPNERERKRLEYINAFVRGEVKYIRDDLEKRRFADPPLAPFHWEIEFPEVFERENSGFDAFIGNPPFMRGKAIGSTLGASYRDLLTELTPDSNASADLVAFFFRRAFAMLRSNGTSGLIATKTISKGDTRRAGLKYICKNGGTIYSARRRLEWPGSAAVIVSTLHIVRGESSSSTLDGVRVPIITAFLFAQGGNDDPVALKENANISFNGCAVAGMGFTFDDNEPRATPLSRMRDLFTADPRNTNRVHPFLGGDEINNSSVHAHRRYVIFFGGMTLDEACHWPDLLEIVREKVKPERDGANRLQHREKWWQFGDWRPGLFAAIANQRRMLCVVFVSQYLAFTWIPTDRIVSHNVGVFACDRDGFFCVLQSRVHELFASQLSSGLEDRPGYRPSDGFETFPFPKAWRENIALEAAGRAYYDFRAALMVRCGEGMTKTYNRFHDPDERDPGILKLRELHAGMDRAVLDAYGWNDIPTDCEFLLDYEIDQEEWGNKKKPYLYRWPDDVRDELLARLLELNAERANAEALAGAASGPKQARKRTTKSAAPTPEPKDLFS
jgi:hypothetical protein